MTDRPPLSRSVKIVAWLFLGLGAFAATELVWKLAAEGVLKVNLLGVPLLVVGYGLLKRRDFWRKCALAVAALYVALAGLVFVLVAAQFFGGVESTVSMTFLGDPVVASVASAAGLPLAAATALGIAAALVIRVLTAADVRRQFAA